MAARDRGRGRDGGSESGGKPSALEASLPGVKPLRGRDKLAPPPFPPRRAARPPRSVPQDETTSTIVASDLPGEGIARGVDRAHLRRLRRGEIPLEARVDLHGLVSAAARRTLERAMLEAFARAQRCVLVVHGRGLGSEQGAVLKTLLPEWLGEPPLAPVVMAFTPAKPRDGGAGATYVLLRRRRPAATP